MTRRATIQSTYSKGELDPDLSERIDLEHYYDSLGQALNCVFHPQGGFSDRGGFVLNSEAAVLASGVKRRLRRALFPLGLTSGMITANNGGTVANLVDQNPTTTFQTNAVTTALFTLFEVDFGSAQRVDFVDLIQFSSETLGADEAIAVDYWDGNAWRRFGDAIGVPTAKHIRTTQRTRRFGVSPGGPGNVPIVARQWRVTAVGVAGIGRVTIGGVRFWRETSTRGRKRVREIARDETATYQAVVTAGNIDIFDDGRYVASVPHPAAEQQISQLSFTGGFDTMIIFHEMIETVRVLRQGNPGEWDVGPAPFVNVPTLQAATIFSGNQDEVQHIDLTGIVAGNLYSVRLGDAVAVRTYASDAQLLTDVKAALQTFPDVATGANDVLVTLVAPAVIQVRFAAANGNRAWPLVAIAVEDSLVVPATTTVVQPGLLSTGAYFEAKTGWPRGGAFVQQRLLVAGFRAAPTSYRFSMNPNVWDFTSSGDPLTDDMGFGGALDVDEIEIINDVFQGRHIQIFTEKGEWYGETRTLAATQPINFVRSSNSGIERGVRMCFVEGSTLFLQQGGKLVRDFLYDDSGLFYKTEALTVLAPHLMSRVIDMAVRPARSVTEGNILVLTNDDGTMAAITLLRGQQVVAGAPWKTIGRFEAVMTDVRYRMWVVTDRAGESWLEEWRADIPLDWATRFQYVEPTKIITGLGYLEGRTDVWAIADRDLYGPLTVAGQKITLPYAVSDVWVGLEPEWRVRGQVLRNKLQQSQLFRPPGRIFEIELSLKETGAISVGTNGELHGEMPLTFGDSGNADGGPLMPDGAGDPHKPLWDRLYTGDVRMDGLLGVSRHPYFELYRARPAPVHVKSVRLEVAMRGGGDGEG